METSRLQALLRSVSNSSATQISIESKSSKIFIKRGPVTAQPSASVETLAKKDVNLPLASGGEKKRDAGMLRAPATTAGQQNDIRSKTIGFFSRFNPKSKKQYIKLRDVVKVGDVLGVVRAMHVDQEVVADKAGKVTHFLIEEGQPVEYGQPLVRLE